MTAAAQRQGGGRTPSRQATAPKKPVGRPKGEPSTMVKVRPAAVGAQVARQWDERTSRERRRLMYTSILLSVALQDWERYSAHALAAREAAATLAKGAAIPLHVLSVYENDAGPVPAGLDSEMAARHRADMLQRTDDLMERRMRDFIAPLRDAGLEVNPILRVGNPRAVIVETARSVLADLLIIGSHSKRGLLDIALGGTARQITHAAPCTVLMVSPKV